jgi:hypothetical protein
VTVSHAAEDRTGNIRQTENSSTQDWKDGGHPRDLRDMVMISREADSKDKQEIDLRNVMQFEINSIQSKEHDPDNQRQ